MYGRATRTGTHREIPTLSQGCDNLITRLWCLVVTT